MDQNSPTHVPQNIQQENGRLQTSLRMLQEEMQKSKEREKASLIDLRKEIQQAQAKLMSEQQQQNESNILTQYVIEKQQKHTFRMSQLAWIDHGFKLNGRDNFALWKRTILRDAECIRARELLEKGEPEEQQMGPVKKAEIENKSILLHIRIFAMLPFNIQEWLEPDRILKPQEIWRRLNARYGISPAEERLVHVKTLMNLHPQGNPAAMMRQWEGLVASMKEKQYTADDICHDIGIILLGDWQREYVRRELDALFAASEKENIHQLNMSELINRLQMRSTRAGSTNGPYMRLSYPFYRQDSRTARRRMAGPERRNQPGE